MKLTPLFLALALVGCGGSGESVTSLACSTPPAPALVRTWSGPSPRVLFIGDSIMAGLDMSLFKSSTVNHGVGGDCTTHILARLKRDALDNKPDTIVMDGGINDVRNGQYSAAYLQQAALDAKAAGVKVVIVGVYPTTGPAVQFRPAALVFHADMEAFSKVHGFTYIDNSAEPVSADGVHPDAAGYVKLAGRIGL